MANHSEIFLETPKINIMVACSLNRVIGRGGRLPWSIREDWEYFLETTKGGVVILGRVCWEELCAMQEVRTDRQYIVISRTKSFNGANISTADSLETALAHGKQMRMPIWICGGQRIYEEAMALADYLYLTLVDAEVEGDTYFPDWREHFAEVVSQRESQDANWSYTFFVLKKCN